MNEAYLFKTLNPVLSIVKLHIFSNKKYYLLSSQFHKPHFHPTKPNSATKPKKKINLTKFFNNTIKKKKKKIHSFFNWKKRKKEKCHLCFITLIAHHHLFTSHFSFLFEIEFLPKLSNPCLPKCRRKQSSSLPSSNLFIYFIYL